MFRDILIFSNAFRIEALSELVDQLDWELEHIYPPRASSHAGRIWTTPDDVRVHYIEDARFYVRYLVLQDDASEALVHKVFASLREVLPTLEASALFDVIDSDADHIDRIEALHKSSALVSPSDSDPAYLEMLRRLLADTEPVSMRLATLQLCEHLAWPELVGHVTPLASGAWPGRELAGRVLASMR